MVLSNKSKITGSSGKYFYLTLLFFLGNLVNINRSEEVATNNSDITQHLNWNLLEHNKCGIGVSDDRIIGGKVANLGQYPWLARLGYSFDEYPDYVSFRCGGSLINKWYILTAAHCAANLLDSTTLSVVRLGEHNMETEIDCDGDLCAPQPQDIEPSKIIIHEKYNSPLFKHDIALIRLSAQVQLNDFVVPICLPYGKLMEKNYTESKAEVAGWGMYNMTTSEASSILLHTNIPLLSVETCNSMFRDVTDVGVGQVCAGGQVGFDTCGGDSGGPLMKVDVAEDEPKYFLIGVVSFGNKDCGSEFPAVYTNTMHYLIWILDHIQS